ncbi:hypothetical protein K525DRAFT_159187, partial [Schizophyllum commune Loenen D]
EPITLAAIMDLPLDILYEIFKHVHPADLLHLTQANKVLRYTLLCPGAKGVWEHSFRTADDPRIPPCLDNKLSLPQYANLIHGEGCFGCGSTSNVHDLFMFLDKRCHACIFKKYVVQYHILSNRGRFAPFDLGHGYPGRMARWTTIAKAYTYLVDKEESARIEDGLAAFSKEVIVYSTSKGAFEGLRSYT